LVHAWLSYRVLLAEASMNRRSTGEPAVSSSSSSNGCHAGSSSLLADADADGELAEQHTAAAAAQQDHLQHGLNTQVGMQGSVLLTQQWLSDL
jgi:hypothetical protein